jgi:hypothetical protein
MVGTLVRGNSHVELSGRLPDEAAVVGSASSGIAVHNIHEFTYGARTTEGIKPSEMGDSAMPNTTHGGIPKNAVTLLRGSGASHEKREAVQKSQDF